MKKLIFLLILFMLLCSSKCKQQTVHFSSYVFEQSYSQNQEKESIHDLFTLLHNYGQDSIPLEKWLTYMGINDEGMVIQQVLTKYESDTLNYVFIYNTLKKKDSTFYDIKVRKMIFNK